MLRFCDRVADLAREGKLRNAPEEVAGVKLSADDLVALEVFLRALNENYECGADGCKVRRRADAGSGAGEGFEGSGFFKHGWTRIQTEGRVVRGEGVVRCDARRNPQSSVTRSRFSRGGLRHVMVVVVLMVGWGTWVSRRVARREETIFRSREVSSWRAAAGRVASKNCGDWRLCSAWLMDSSAMA